MDGGSPAPLTFGSKAETLAWLGPHLKGASLLPQVLVTGADWRRACHEVMERVATFSPDVPLIVRSSAVGEDRAGASLAGAFLSVKDVAGRAALQAAIEAVFASYGREHDADQVLIQPMLAGVRLSGVAFSRDPSNGAPYDVISVATGTDTSAVTAGTSAAIATHYHHHASPPPADRRLGAVCILLRELDMLFAAPALDVEFAFSADDRLYLLQVRPLICTRPPVNADRHRPLLDTIAAKIETASRPHPYLRGRRTVFGVMPDWNPAEIIGVRPRALALSLYRELVTDSIWAYQRHNYGYRNLRSFPLLLSLHGLPYIDVRVSFNSFIPADIPDGLADQLVDWYVDRLVAAPVLHDKVEFEIVHSCYTPDIAKRLQPLAEGGFAAGDLATLQASLRQLTNRVINRKTGLWQGDLARIDELDRRRKTVESAGLDKIGRLYWLIEDCKRYGTLPFAGLARAGFIAMQMLQALISVGILDEADKASFLAGLDTISAEMARDWRRLERPAFLARYGHLRPGTYDILSPRYDEAPERYFAGDRPLGLAEAAGTAEPFRLSLGKMRAIEAMLSEHGLEQDVVGLFDFLEAGIKGREYAKFVFTRSLSDVLRLFARLGDEHGLTIDDLSHADVSVLRQLQTESGDVGDTLRRSIAQGRRRYEETTSITLPPVIFRPEDAWSFEQPATAPNYITQSRVTAPACELNGVPPEGIALAGTIVLIPGADPGYDWLFTRGIAGFVTAYGGANSHMAIRAGELRLPAVIGVGEALYGRLRRARAIAIDCAARQITPLS